MKIKKAVFLASNALLLATYVHSVQAEQAPFNHTELVADHRQTVPDSIDLSKIPFSEKELGEFPFLKLPANITTLNKPLTREFDRLFFPYKGVMIPVEGHVYKAFLTSVEGKEWSLPYFEKTYREQIIAAGGVLIFSGKVAPSELNRIKDEASYFGEEGSIDYANTLVRVYAIRRKTGDHVFIQFSGYSSGGSIQILQKEASK
ncbi:hypothetical protein [Dyadobacter sp. Leaf189]|uniref:hypothetical protein n=1 Tax=Dyadobacter sp. Leaf189 TaxID=1736295 RepID=UPI0006F95775|nr:hypothetical protein [Dyadobacter sp. Leaf189]KQS27920.1 hypothetical protein ASG33_16060 [Dyadobacter sp. Leaf189]